jgi:hypothetical protein
VDQPPRTQPVLNAQLDTQLNNLAAPEDGHRQVWQLTTITRTTTRLAAAGNWRSPRGTPCCRFSWACAILLLLLVSGFVRDVLIC